MELKIHLKIFVIMLLLYSISWVIDENKRDAYEWYIPLSASVITFLIVKKLIEAQKDETIRFVSWLCNTGKIQDILEHKKTEAELYDLWISKI